MNKAKIVLSGVALFAVVGGAFAFKANRYIAVNKVYTSYTTLSGTSTVTRCAPINFATTAQGGALSTVYTTTTTFAGVPGVYCVTAALTTTNITATLPGM